MSEESEKEEIETIDLTEKKEEEEEEEEDLDGLKNLIKTHFSETDKSIDEHRPAKTRPKKVTNKNDDLPTCPHCHEPVQETNDGWVCYKCKRGYIK